MLRSMRVWSVPVVLAVAGVVVAAEPTDHTDVNPASLGVTFIQPKKEASGFVVGGKNATARIRKLPSLAGRSIADLEKDMRPGGFSSKGFLGKDERLLDILAADNALVVEKHGLTHQQLARHLHLVGALVRKNAPGPFTFRYHGHTYQGTAKLFRGFAESPFEDGTRTNCEVTLENRGNGKKLTYSLLVPHLIERYGFYEGRGTPYRVDPAAVLAVFDFLKK